MSEIEAKLEALGLSLPRPAAPPSSFELVREAGGFVFVAGHGPADGDEVLMQGMLGQGILVEEGYRAARLAALSMFATFEASLGGLDRVGEWVRVTGYVTCVPRFARTIDVVNGFSDLVLELWGERGRHSRVAVGVAALPFDFPVLVEATVRLAAPDGF